MEKNLPNFIHHVGEQLINEFTGQVSHNRYTLTINKLSTPISILNVNGEEQLNQLWRYTITFTSTNPALAAHTLLNQPASFSFNPTAQHRLSDAIRLLSDFPIGFDSRKLYGIITEFKQLSINKDQAHYQVVLSPKIARLSLNRSCAIFQNQSVVNVIEQVLRSHGLSGIDYRLALKAYYPVRELITQWQESDLEFIQRLMADVGIWFRFESDAEHNCEVMVISDDEQGYGQLAKVAYQLPSGTLDGGKPSIWDISVHSQTVESTFKVQDYNYRDAKASLLGQVNTQPKDTTTHGTHYLYGEHYKGLDSNRVNHNLDNQEATSDSDDNAIESGNWYARIRHEHAISHQTLIKGKTNQYNLAPGQRIYLNGHPLTHIDDGLVILSVTGKGNRTDAYQLSFTAIPFNSLKPYRPAPIAWPQISGTLPARVTSPDNDTYGYIDTQGRYRVKFNFDLKEWKKGNESLWIRLAKPYAGDRYGFHFPLIDGTDVAIAFMGGNPDRPYIAHAMHDSSHPDLVTTANKHRNVIRTAANNKLRMDDKRGQEHIKLATEYGKTQLNMGHLVNQNKEGRGEGFELRTDEWGAIAANKGLYLTTETEPKAQGKQLDMQAAITQLENALSIAKALQNAATQSDAHSADIDSQQQLNTALSQLTQSGLLAYAQEGIALTSPQNIQLTTGNSLTLTAENQTDITALNNITVSSSEAIGLFAHKSGMKLFANQGDIDLQAQNANLNMAAKQDIKVDSVNGEVTITASKQLTLICGGSYIKLSSEGIELGTAGNIYFKGNVMQKMGMAQKDRFELALPEAIETNFSLNKANKNDKYSLMYLMVNDEGEPYKNIEYLAFIEDGSVKCGKTDNNGYTERFYTRKAEKIAIRLVLSKTSNGEFIKR
jgi:type VI secretion system secreted protein VgrG